MANLCGDIFLRSLLIIRVMHDGEKVARTGTRRLSGRGVQTQGGSAREKSNKLRTNRELPRRNRVRRLWDRMGTKRRRCRAELREPGNQSSIRVERQSSNQVGG